MAFPHDAPRCFWVGDIAEFIPYHDHEWGYPVDDDTRLFEKMSLESFQSGLSWRTILNKREHFRRAFAGFSIDAVASFGAADVERLLQDAGIVRHRGKIEAVIHNAGVAQDLIRAHGSLAAFVWQFEPQEAERPETVDAKTVRAMANTDASKRLSQALKKAGWRFFGPTTAYAFMQSMGLVNDHEESCIVRSRVEEARATFTRPV